MKEGIAIIIVLLLAIGALVAFKGSKVGKTPTRSTQQIQINETSSQTKSMESTTTAPIKKHNEVTLHTTEGDIVIALNADQTPNTVQNFVKLASSGFYNNTIFHRVIKGFMIQGGDPKGDGTGGPGYKFADEPFTGEYTRGAVAMANSGPNTNGSQFFIMHADYPLPHNYVIFGHVVKGMDAVDKIANAPTTMGMDGGMSKPINPVKVLSAAIIEQ